MKKHIILGSLFLFFLTAGASLWAQANYVTVPVGVFKSDGVVDINKGTLSCWIRLTQDITDRAQFVVFHSSDNRLVLYLDNYWSEKAQRNVLKISARAGGNQKVKNLFPEASLRIDNDGSLKEYKWITAPFLTGQWHLITMVWDGYPDGVVRLFMDGKFMVERTYDASYDDGRELLKSFSVGFRSRNFAGQVTKIARGSMEEKPTTDLSLKSGGIEMKDLHIYRRALKEETIGKIFLEQPAE